MYPLRKLTQAVPDGCMRFFLSRYLQKKANTPRRARKKAHSTTGQLLHITLVIRLKAFWYFLLRCLSAYNYIMCKGIKPSSHCLHLPNLPTPLTFQAVASHSLLVPRNFMPFTAPTAANISSYLVISAAKSFPLSS